MLSTTTVAVGIGLGSLGAAAVARTAYQKRLDKNKLISATDFNNKQMDRIKEVISDAEKLRSTPLKLYQFEICPYCHKLKCFFDHHKLSYETVEVNPINKKEITNPEYKKVPQLTLGDNGTTIVDSGEIIKMINPVLTGQKEFSESEIEWEKRCNKVIQLLVLNTNRTTSEAREGFQYANQINNFSGMDKMIITKIFPYVMYFVTNRMIKPRVFKRENYPEDSDIRTELFKEINNWIESGVGKGPFHGGDKPSVADITYFGTLQSQAKCSAFKDIVENVKQPQFNDWYSNMEKACTPKE